MQDQFVDFAAYIGSLCSVSFASYILQENQKSIKFGKSAWRPQQMVCGGRDEMCGDK